MLLRLAFVIGAISAWGCASGGMQIPPRGDAGPRADAQAPDGGDDALDAAVEEDAAGPALDGGLEDAGIDDDAGELDAAIDDGDAGIVLDAGTDAGPLDAGTDAGTDAGGVVTVPVIDGIVSDPEWASAVTVSSDVASVWAGNELRRMRAILTPGGLYLAIEGRIDASTPANAITVYLDRAVGTTEGRDLATLTDSTGAVDDALSPSAAAPYTVPAGFVADLGWATNAMSRSASGPDARTGWRDFVRAASPADLFWISAAEAPTTCGADACETFLPRAMLDAGMGATRPRTIALFARITNHDGSQSPNQTLPMDAGATPRVVSALLELDE